MNCTWVRSGVSTCLMARPGCLGSKRSNCWPCANGSLRPASGICTATGFCPARWISCSMKIFAVAAKNRLYECLNRIDAHRAELFIPLQARWKDLFGAAYNLLLYDLTSTYFEGAMEQTPSGPT